MKNSSNNHILENKIFVRVIAAITGLLGLTLLFFAARLWHVLSVGTISLMLIYGCLLLFVVFYVLRIESEFANKVHTVCFWLLSAGMAGAALNALMAPPYVLDLPLYHPKTFSCLAVLASAAVFARKAWTRH